MPLDVLGHINFTYSEQELEEMEGNPAGTAKRPWPTFKGNEVLKTGLLTKRAQGKSKLGKINWKERYFQLTGFSLTYFDGNPQLDGLDRKVVKKGTIPVAKIRQVTECTPN